MVFEGKIGFLGAGNLAQAIAQGIIDSETAEPANIIASARTDAGLAKICKMGVSGTLNNKKVVDQCSVIFLVVPPGGVPDVLREISEVMKGDKLLVSTVCSTTNEQITAMIGKATPVIRAIPSTPVAVREGVIRAYPGAHCQPHQVELCRTLMEPLGLFTVLPDESLINLSSGLCGCSPAFVYMMIDAMATGGVKMGLPRDVAVRMAAQTVVGSGRMVLEAGDGKHVGQLINDVCTPGGVTVEGVWELEKAGFRGSVMGAVIRSTEASLEKVGRKEKKEVEAGKMKEELAM